MMWQWQQRFDPIYVEGACQRQILKIRKSKPYSLWLKEKATACRNYRLQESSNNHDTINKVIGIDTSFRDWLCRKHMIKKQKTAADIITKDRAKITPRCKPPSLHVNPKSKIRCTSKVERTLVNEGSLHRKHSESENKQAYNAWLARTRLEDRARQCQRRIDLERLKKQQRERHRITWQKKLAVCAYSTLAQ